MMKRLFVPCLMVAAVVFAGSASAEDEAMELKVGDMAPDFKLMGSDGESYTLAQFKGKKHVVLAFFPKSFTPG